MAGKGPTAWQKQVVSCLPGEPQVSYDALWEHPDKHLVELTPQERKEFAWQLAELGKRHTKTPAAAKPILMLCYMALRGELAAQEGDIEFIIQDLKCCLSPKDPGVESAACAAMSVLLMRPAETADSKWRAQILDHLTGETAGGSSWWILRDRLLAVAFAINSLARDECEAVYDGIDRIVHSTGDTADMEKALCSPPMRDLMYLLAAKHEEASGGLP